MAQHKSAEKRARISKRRAARNTVLKSKMRTAIKRVRSTSEKEKAVVELRKTSKRHDQLAAKGIIHKNRAANNKSSLTKFVNKLK
jgi:small subunit ribosomal protein S20